MLQSHIVHDLDERRRRRSAPAVGGILLALAGGATYAQGEGTAAPMGQVGWLEVALPELSSRFERYVPQGVDIAAGTPLVVFLHNTATGLQPYRESLTAAAREPRSSPGVCHSRRKLISGLRSISRLTSSSEIGSTPSET